MKPRDAAKKACRVMLAAAVVSLCIASGFGAIDASELQRAQEKLLRNETTAAADFQRFEAVDPKNSAVQRGLSGVALRTGRWDEALERAQRALELDPSLANVSEFQCELGDAHGMLAANGGVFGKFGHAKKCRLAYEKASELDPKNFRARWSLMEFYRHAPGFIGGSIEKSYAQAFAIKELNPGAGRYAHALVLVSDKKPEDALALFRDISPSATDDYSALSQLGRVALLTSLELDRGIEALRRCTGLPAPAYEPSHLQVHFMIGQLLDKKGDNAAARTAYEAALAIDPKFEPALKALGRKA